MEELTFKINIGLVWLFSRKSFALELALGLLLFCAAIIFWVWLTRYRPLKHELARRADALRFVDEAGSIDEAQLAFRERFDSVSEAMTRTDRKSGELRHAWAQFTETIIDSSEPILRATSRPDGYFLHIGEDIRILNWWANIFVALGLVFTFLGIVAALTQATNSMTGSADMQKALTELLLIASAKFWTSIAGVLSSIILRFFDRWWRQSTRVQLEKICEWLEHGTLFSPPQRIAADQLKELREQSVQLKNFGHELAIAIGDQFESRMQPMMTVLGSIDTSITQFRDGSFTQIGKEFGNALRSSAGQEMEALSTSLAQMTQGLAAMHQRLEGSSAAADRQMEEAARQFVTASEAMTRAFATMNERMEKMTASLADRMEAVAEHSANRLAENQAEYQAAARDNAEAVRMIGAELRTAGGEGATALKAAAAQASAEMASAVGEAVRLASEESGRAINEAVARFGESFEAASTGLVTTLQATAVRFESAAAAIDRSARASDDHATRVAAAAQSAQGVATMLDRAANDVMAATGPIREATATISTGIISTRALMQQQADTLQNGRDGFEAMATGFRDSAAAAAQAWSDYRARFEGVDKALADALDKIRDASAEHAGHLNGQIGRIDTAFAGAVDKLAAALEPLQELAASVEDVLGRLKEPA